MRAWLYHIGRSPDLFCDCGAIQNAAHLMECKLVGDGAGRSWCEVQRVGLMQEVFNFVIRNTD